MINYNPHPLFPRFCWNKYLLSPMDAVLLLGKQIPCLVLQGRDPSDSPESGQTRVPARGRADKTHRVPGENAKSHQLQVTVTAARVSSHNQRGSGREGQGYGPG